MLKVYNTLTRKKEELVPIKDGIISMYSCGPTVYNFAHIGNLRTYIFMDLLRRSIKFCGLKVKGVMNITDVGHLLSDADDGEDKMVKAASEFGKTPEEIASFFSGVFFKDLKLLNIQTPEIVAKATDNITEMIDFVVDLQKKGFAYETDDGIYFDISKFPSYGSLSHANLDDRLAGARVEENKQKRHPADFALWKKADKNHIMQWDSPYGKGYPGWHIECSAMSKKYLGKKFDIHTGGADHIPIHHENEIAQNEAAAGSKTVNYWMHGEFMLVDGGKMSKSLGNAYTLDDLQKKGYSPLAFRLFCLNAHYRKKLNFTYSGLDAAKTALERLYASLYKCKTAAVAVKTDAAVIEKYKKEFYDAVTDDLNIPLALGILFTMLKETPANDLYALALEFDKVFGLSFDKITMPKNDETDNGDLPDNIKKLAEQRLSARQNKDFKESDRLRDELSLLGYAIEDQKDGYTLKKK